MKKIVYTSAVALAAAGLISGIVSWSGNAGAAVTKAPTAAVGQAAPLDLANANVKYAKKGATVTIAKQGAVVATITLQSATYTATGGRVVFTVDAKRPIVVNRDMFILWDANGAENAATRTTNVTYATGRHKLQLDFTGTTGRPEAVGWAPSDGEAVWAR
jgi:antitoxin (DNA-binding transcriptional repressor) of toxin-antitoxin stability system